MATWSPAVSFKRKVFANQFGAPEIIRPDKWNFQVILVKYLFFQPVVYIDNGNTCGMRSCQCGHNRL